MSDSKIAILDNIRKGLKMTATKKLPSKKPITFSKFILEDAIDVAFASNFTHTGGYFFYCEDFKAFFTYLKDISAKRNWRNIYCWNNELVEYFQSQDFRPVRIGHILDKAHAGLTTCEFIIAENGGIMVSSQLPCGRMLPIYPPNWLVIATVGQLVESQEKAWQKIKEKYNEQPLTMVSMINKNAQTRVFEGRPNKGGVGPQNIFLFLLDEETLEIPKIESRFDQWKKSLPNKTETEKEES